MSREFKEPMLLKIKERLEKIAALSLPIEYARHYCAYRTAGSEIKRDAAEILAMINDLIKGK